jgi:general secretion pathway protein E
MDESLRALVHDRADAATLREAARRAGMRTLHEDAVRLVREGVTSVEEARRVAPR